LPAGDFLYFASMYLLKCIFIFACNICFATYAQHLQTLKLDINPGKTFQTIENFGASDAWSCQFVGGWPAGKKEQIADWLFSMDTFSNGNAKGIGLSMWRYNLGAGSAEQGDRSGIRDTWRRASLTSSNSSRVMAQNWWLKAAKERGVSQFLAFYNSPPVIYTRNKKAFAVKGICNIDSSQYNHFAQAAIDALKNIESSTGINFQYLSPVNEPQWEWSDGGQEGSPYYNEEISSLVKSFNAVFKAKQRETKLIVTESGSHRYLLPNSDKPHRENQVYTFFNSSSKNYIGNLPSVAPVIASHSYFTTSPYSEAIALRQAIHDTILQYKNLSCWQSEYCILGGNSGEIDGNRRDTGMAAALYLAKVIYEDLVALNVTAWQWWLAISPYNYKDGLVYVEQKQADGWIADSKMLWAMGNYSRFIRPGMKRIEAGCSDNDILVSGFKDDQGKLVIIVVNPTASARAFEWHDASSKTPKDLIAYITDHERKLAKLLMSKETFVVPGQSVCTLIMN